MSKVPQPKIDLPLTGLMTVQFAVRVDADAEVIEARKRLWARYDRATHSFFLIKLRGDISLAEDLAQSFLLKMFAGPEAKITKYQPDHEDGKGFRPWFITCASHFLSSEFRKGDFRLRASFESTDSLSGSRDERAITPEELTMQAEEPTEEELQNFHVSWAYGVIQEAIRQFRLSGRVDQLHPLVARVISDLLSGESVQRAEYQKVFQITDQRIRALYLQLRNELKPTIRQALFEDGLMPFRDNLDLSVDAVFNLVGLQSGPSKETKFRAKI